MDDSKKYHQDAFDFDPNDKEIERGGKEGGVSPSKNEMDED